MHARLITKTRFTVLKVITQFFKDYIKHLRLSMSQLLINKIDITILSGVLGGRKDVFKLLKRVNFNFIIVAIC